MKPENANIEAIEPNKMGTTSITMKIKGMRKPQSFTVYPLHEGNQTEEIKIQSDTRLGKIELKTGKGLMTQSHQNGAYQPHFSTDKLTPFQLSGIDLQTLKMQIFASQGKDVGNKVVSTDNSGAGKVL